MNLQSNNINADIDTTHVLQSILR